MGSLKAMTPPEFTPKADGDQWRLTWVLVRVAGFRHPCLALRVMWGGLSGAILETVAPEWTQKRYMRFLAANPTLARIALESRQKRKQHGATPPNGPEG